MTETKPLLSKLLSHRMRGYSNTEHAPSSFQHVGDYPISYFEVDTRVSCDGVIFIYHDPTFTDIKGGRHRLGELNSSKIRTLRHPDGEPIATLDQALYDFSKYSRPDQIFCIDIKDYGFESEHLDIVRSYNIEYKVVFVSWIPQSLYQLAQLGCQSPLILSHWNLVGFGKFGFFVSRLLRSTLQGLGPFVFLGKERTRSSLNRYAHGYQHCLVTSDIPSDLLVTLNSSGGGICVHTTMVKTSLIEYCKQNSLALWVFSINDVPGYKYWLNKEGVDVIFCDDAPGVARSLETNISSI
ncbi:MAG: glycerophosphodiester phosphodiesterase family protein [Candidatus Thiodiazotropha sp. DIVDIV]